jgi:hypothetical protein
VKIVLSKNETHVLDENLCSCADDIWYPTDHFAEMKAAGKRDAREGRRMGLGVLLADTFATPGPHAQDSIAAFCRLDGSGSSSIGSDDIGDDILVGSHTFSSTSRRGLERSLSRRHGEERSELKDRARRAVLIHQTSLTRQGAKPDEITEKIANVYMKHCRSARLLARRFGIADELAVAASDDDDPNGAALLHAEARQMLTAALGGDKTNNSNNIYNRLNNLELFGDASKCVSGGRRTAQRRFSNASLASSTHSVNSYDSNRRFCGGGDRCRAPPRRTSSRTCPAAEQPSSANPPTTALPSDELYVAAIA